MTKEKSNNLWLIIFGAIIVILLVWIIFANTNKEKSVVCQRPYIMGDDGKCCKDIDEDNFCDPSKLKTYWEYNGVRDTNEADVYETYAKVCNDDKYSGKITAYFGDWTILSDQNYFVFSEEDLKEVPQELKDRLQSKQVTLQPGQCYEFSFKSVYTGKGNYNIQIETSPIIE